jgi:DNA topoisomerase-1
MKNFIEDFNEINAKCKLSDIDKVDYHECFEFVNRKSVEPKEKIDNKLLYAELDGKQVKILNPFMERPNIFRGKGRNDMEGRLKRPILREQVQINISMKNQPSEIKQHKWKEVIEDHSMYWIAHWRDPITKKQKYIWLDNTTTYKKSKDQDKFDIAKKLSENIRDIRAKYLSLVQNGANE